MFHLKKAVGEALGKLGDAGVVVLGVLLEHT